MKFQNKTTYNRKTLEKLNQTVSRAKAGRAGKSNQVLMSILPLALFGSGFYIFREQGASALAIGEMVIGGFLLVWFPLYPRFQSWMASKLMLKNDPVYTMDFDNKDYTVSSTTANGQPQKMKYDGLWRLYETAEYFVLLLDKRSGFILDKNGFTEGDAAGFRTFMEYKADMDFQKIDL